MKVIWGGNELTDCVALLASNDKIMLSVLPSPVRVDFIVPATIATPFPVEIRSNRVTGSGSSDVRVAESPGAVAVFWRNMPILMAQEVAESTVLLHTDFRPLGMEIFDDAAGLHIGSGVLAANNFVGCSIGIALG